jgi:hypothetical protein
VGYDTANRGIGFAPDKPPPAGLVTKLVKVAETDAAAGK